MLLVRVIPGDVTNMPQSVDAIATLVNSKGDWLSDFDKTLKNHTHYYHLKLSFELERLDDEEEQTQDGKVYIVKGERLPPNQSFKDVIFVIDNSGLKLPVLVFNVLEAAHLAGYNCIAIPPLGISSTSGSLDILRAVRDIKQAIFNFKKQYPASNMMLYIVVNNDRPLQILIRDNF